MILTHIAGIDVRALADEFGTPTYVYDQAAIEARIDELRGIAVIRFAQKANSNIAILDLMRRNGVLVEAISAGEIHRALRAGYVPADIVYTADIFDHAALDLVDELDIRANCGSPDMIRQLGNRCPGRQITLRINPGFGHGHSQKTNTGGEQSKHGIWHEDLHDALTLARAHGLTVTGIHMHIGSGTDLEHLSQVATALVEICCEVGTDLSVVSAGGGLPIPYREDEPRLDVRAYAKIWLDAKQRMEQQLGHPVELEIEPGRYLVAEAGHLICEIRAVKRMGRMTYYLLDAGFNNLARPVLYGAYHPMSICPRGRPAAERLQVIVGGRLCESGDIFTQREGGFVETRELPRADVGDLLIIHCAGAYSFSMASNYNSSPLAAEVLVTRGRPHLIRERQTLDDLIRGERIPATD
jgi:diaminopimelate decarboxylase